MSKMLTPQDKAEIAAISDRVNDPNVKAHSPEDIRWLLGKVNDLVKHLDGAWMHIDSMTANYDAALLRETSKFELAGATQ